MPGRHLTLDLYECQKGFELQDPQKLRWVLQEVINLAGMKLVWFNNDLLYEEFDSYLGWGWSISAILADSHTTIHTAPSKGNSAFFDVFSCMDFDVDCIVKVFLDTFDPVRYTMNNFVRNAGVRDERSFGKGENSSFRVKE